MAPNRLGRLLRYFSSAWIYAKAGDTRPKYTVANMLDRMASSGTWYSPDLIDVDTATRYAVASYATYSAIKLIADRVVSAKFTVERETGGDTEEIAEHPFTGLMRRPNTLMSGSFMMRYAVWWHLLRGNSYIFVSTPGQGTGEPVEFWPLPADLIRARPDTLRRGVGVFSREQVIDYEYTVLGWENILLPGENVIHFRKPNPFDYWTGMSPLTAALVTIEMDNSQAEWVRDFFARKNAVPSAIMSVPAETSETDFEIITEMLREQFEDGQRTLVTRAGDLSVEVIQHTLEQMQVLATREFNQNAIDRVYGIPEGLITGGLSGDSRLAAETAFARNTVQPLIDYLAEEFTAQLSPYYGSDVMVVGENVVPQDRALDVQEYTIYSQDRTINENRETLGLEPLDNPLAGDVPVRLLQWVAPNYATIDGEEPEPEPVPPALVAYQNGTQPPQEQAGPQSMEGTPTPEQEAEIAAKTVTNGHSPALDVALATELKRWRKVATREAKAGRNPAEREFESEIVPPELAAELRAVLDGADEAGVRDAFQRVTDDTMTEGELDTLRAVALEYQRAAAVFAEVLGGAD